MCRSRRRSSTTSRSRTSASKRSSCATRAKGHGVRETKHVEDNIDRRIRWYEQALPEAGAEGVTNVQP